MPSRSTNDGRAGRGGLRRLTFASAALLLLLSATADTSFGQTPGRKLIVTAAGARLRERPETAAAETGRLGLGAVVDGLERSADKSRVGSTEEFWHLVAAPGGARGWVFGGLVAPYDPARRDETYLKLSAERLANASATFAELSELVRFLDRAAKEVTRREARAPLELARLNALARSLASFDIGAQDKEPYKSWTKEREAEIVYSEPAGQWYVRAELLWNLELKYRGLPAAERAAWAAAETPMPGECEGYLPCYLYMVTGMEGRYLKLYPRGPHPVYEVPREDRANFSRSLASLRAQLVRVPAAKKARLLGQLDAVARRFR